MEPEATRPVKTREGEAWELGDEELDGRPPADVRSCGSIGTVGPYSVKCMFPEPSVD